MDRDDLRLGLGKAINEDKGWTQSEPGIHNGHCVGIWLDTVADRIEELESAARGAGVLLRAGSSRIEELRNILHYYADEGIYSMLKGSAVDDMGFKAREVLRGD